MEQAGLTGVELARQVGCSNVSVSRIINGRQQPGPSLMFRMAKVLHRPIADFYANGVPPEKRLLSELEDEELKIIEAMRALPPEEREAIALFASATLRAYRRMMARLKKGALPSS